MKLKKISLFVRCIVALVISFFVISAFLSHWSLLDGAPRNSLKLFIDGQAHRPFAYRVLGPAVISAVDTVLPESVQDFLAEAIAPKFRIRYVEPLMSLYESRLPGITHRAETDWSEPTYRRAYILMVIVIFLSFFSAALLIYRCANLLGTGPVTSSFIMLAYAAILPTMFLNGGYFYDFIEQLGVCLLIFYVLQNRWFPALVILLLMQINKETALLMVFFLIPYGWSFMKWRILSKAALAISLCLFIFIWIRIANSNLPGNPTEWHFPGNLIFWSNPASWTSVTDFYSLGLELPRMTFLIFAIASLAFGWYTGSSPLVLSATFSFVILAILLFIMGFQDEFRNLSLSVPLLTLIWAERISKRKRASIVNSPKPRLTEPTVARSA